MNFDQAYRELLGDEGDLSMDPNDPGNWTGGKIGKGVLNGTKYGISAASYPKEDISGMTLERAKYLTRRDYWDRYRIEELPDALRWHVFDGVFNSGPGSKKQNKGGAIRWLQSALGVTDDGVMGPITISAAKSVDVATVLFKYNGERLMHITRLASWPTQGKGLVRRVAGNMLATQF
jgi:lysozyme family protein